MYHDALGMNMVAGSVICLLEGLFYGTRNSADDITSCFPTFSLACFFLQMRFQCDCSIAPGAAVALAAAPKVKKLAGLLVLSPPGWAGNF